MTNVESHPVTHTETHQRSAPGGIKLNITTIDATHPLATVDPTLETILTTLTPKILSEYRKAKHLTASDVVEFEPVAYTTQVVSGVNYFVKLHVKTAAAATVQEYIHVKIFSQAWTHTTELTGLSVNKKVGDSLRDPIDPVA